MVERTAFVACCWVRLRLEVSFGTAPLELDLYDDLLAAGAELPEGPDVELLRKNPSIAEPITVASTIVPLVVSVQDFCLALGTSLGLLSLSTSLACKRLSISSDNAIAVLLLRMLFLRAMGS